MCLLILIYESVGPVLEKWTAENRRRDRVGEPKQGLRAYIGQMCCGSAEADEGDEGDKGGSSSLTSSVAELLQTARGAFTTFNSRSQRQAWGCITAPLA